MLRIRPVVLIGVGAQAQKTVQDFVRLVRQRQGYVPALLPVIVQYAPHSPAHAQDRDQIHVLSLSDPVFEGSDPWPTWFPPEQKGLTDMERARTRAWMHAALLQRADDLQEFLLERVPQLLSFDTVEALRSKDLALERDSRIEIYVIADLSDHLASGILIDLAHLTAHVCRQLGRQAGVTGLLFLPNSTSPAPAEEAVAYAALKELEHYTRGHPYNGGIEIAKELSQSHVPFDNGCYLLDDVNEAGYTLRDPGQLLAAACEYLYAMIFQNLATAVRDQSQRRYRTATLRGKARSYESFGVASRYIPRRLLARWTEARLGGRVLESVLHGESGVDAAQKASNFVERIGLDIQTLENTLRKTDVSARIGQSLESLRRVTVGQIEARARQVLHAIRQQHLPVLDHEVGQISQTLQQEHQAALLDELETSLQDLPTGGVELQRRFLQELRVQVGQLGDQLQDRIQQQQRELARSLGTVSETYYALRNVAMGTPPWPAALLSVTAVLLLPLLYISAFLAQRLYLDAPAALLAALGILGLGTVGVSGFVISRLLRQRRMLCERHIAMVRQRAILESRPAVHREIGALYDAILQVVAQADSEFAALAGHLEDAQARCQAKEAEQLRVLLERTRPGPFRSVIDQEMAEAFYLRAVPNLERTTAILLQQGGPLSRWLARSTELGDSFAPWIDEQIAGLCALHLDKTVQRFTISEALTHRQDDVQRLAQALIESAQPMWNYDPRFLRRAVTQRLTFVSVDADSPAWTDVARSLAKVCPNAVVHNTDDSSTLTILNIHLGVPLFALRRIGQYRSHYAEMLWRGKLPIHTTGKLTLAGDLIPMRRIRTQAHTLFAVGLALGVVQREESGRYVAPRGDGKTIRLSAQKERSAALMGMDAATCLEVERRVQHVLAKEGGEALRDRLNEYASTAPDLTDWEIAQIARFGRTHAQEAQQALARS